MKISINKNNTLVHIKTIYQRNLYECGLAALVMILNYYGININMDQLKSNIEITEIGCTAKILVENARKYGLNARGLHIKSTELGKIKAPYIIYYNYNHYVVYIGKVGDFIYVLDPALGKCKVPVETFNKYYGEIILQIQPYDEKSRKGGCCLYTLKNYKYIFDYVFIIFTALITFLISIFINYKLKYKSFLFIIFLLIKIIILIIITKKSVLYNSNNYKDKLYKIPVVFFLYNRLNHEEQLMDYIAHIYINIILLISDILQLVLLKYGIYALSFLMLYVFLIFIIFAFYLKVFTNNISKEIISNFYKTILIKSNKKFIFFNNMCIFILLTTLYLLINKEIISNFLSIYVVYILFGIYCLNELTYVIVRIKKCKVIINYELWNPLSPMRNKSQTKPNENHI
jgi:ABC-type bacteriocin/lantibiotic exporter with double-glycine peptidase domain